jgi:hypothetical protein
MKQHPDREILKKEEMFWRRIKQAGKNDPYQSCRK